MKYFASAALLLACFGAALSQAPVNDNCSGIINLGVVPACPTTVFTNVNATTSNIGFGNNPSCFNGGTAQRDVWFAFTAGDTLVDVTIALTATNTGPNSPIANPQIAVYRGDCVFNGLAEIACVTSPPGSNQTSLDLLGLSPGVTYFLRINDYSATAAPNWGDFTLCITEYVPAFNMGQAQGTTSCFGTLYDSGGPTGNYQNNQNLTFTICPTDAHECIELVVTEYNMELNRDRLNVYNGASITAPLVASVTGVNAPNQPFRIQASTTGCVTVQFVSDGSVVGPGFALTWSCSPLACTGTSFNNPVVINSLPFNQSGTTCNDASNFADSPCPNDAFLNGHDVVYRYDSPGGVCISVQITGANTGTGVAILNGLPGNPNTICMASSALGSINSADLRTAGTYYIIVANAGPCTPYNISVSTTDCELPPGLANALCNPLNGCQQPGGAPSVFNFQDGFQDIPLIQGVNQGCWLSVGAQADFYWFTIEAQADGPFGFILAGAGPPSDIDFSVWGPFTREQVCQTPGVVINTVSNSQPIRSSWTGGSQPTGMADIHPVTGITVTDDYDCGSPATPGAGGDRFVRTIPAQQGQVYVVLVNDFGNLIGSEGIAVDWSPSRPEVLAPLPTTISGLDTIICIGESVQFNVNSGIGTLSWVDPNGTLSCTNCPNPTASPTASTTYSLIVDGVCYDQIIPVTVKVYDVNAGPDVTVCRNEQFQIVAGEVLPNASYQWSAPGGITLSCTNCADPILTAAQAGTYPVVATLVTPNCTLRDTMILEVLPQLAPQVTILRDTAICEGANVAIGGAAAAGVSYSWSSQPAGFVSFDANPSVAPAQTTTYYLSASNAECPFPSVDSVRVQVDFNPQLAVASDTALCQGQPILMGNTTVEVGVVYAWTGPDNILEPENPNSIAEPQSSGTYTLRATRGACAVDTSFNVTIIPIDIQIQAPDTIKICLGETVDLSAFVVPANAQAVWTPNFEIAPNVGNNVQATPTNTITYTATVTVPGCQRTDLVRIEVDSLPFLRDIMPDVVKDPYCPGEIVILSSETYEPSDFPNLRFRWLQGPGYETPDTLWNMVITTTDTFTFRRVLTNGACVDTTTITLNVVEPPTPRVIPSDTIICTGDRVQLLALDYGDYDISWTPEAGLSCTDCPNPIATPGATTVYTLQVDVPNCPVGASANIVVEPGPTVAMSPNQVVCKGTAVQLNNAFDVFSIYTWRSSTDPNFISADPLLVVTPEVTTTYTLTAVRGNCVPQVFSVTITVVQPPTAAAGPDQTICIGGSVNLAGVVGGSATSGFWTATPNTGTFSPNANTLNTAFTPAQPGVYALLLTAADPSNVCTTAATDELILTVNPKAEVNAGPDTTICAGGAVRLQGAIGGGATSAVWSASVPGGTFNPNASTLNALYTPPAGFTSVALTLLTDDPDGPCPAAADTMIITIVPPATVDAGPDQTICRGSPLTLSATGSAPASTDQLYTWTSTVLNQPENGRLLNISNTGSFPPQVNFVVTYRYGPNLRCGGVTDTVRITVADPIVIDSLNAAPREVFAGQEVTLNVVTTPAAPAGAMYFWREVGKDSIMGDATFRARPTPTFGPGQERVTVAYEVIIKSAEGCRSTLRVEVVVIKPFLDFPNVFTPNGDGKNDVFLPVPEDVLSSIEILDFRVYNRWGQVVYDGRKNNNEGWDGTHNGSPAPADVYVYRVRYRVPGQEVQDAKGDLTLIR